MLNAIFRRLAEWPGKQTPLDLLERELDHLGARDVVIQIAVDRRDIRNDGWPKASCRPAQPGVVLTFTRGGTPLQFACDTFTGWESKLRAIGLTLEALRAVDRYGRAQSGEQYRATRSSRPARATSPP